jgi:two-component system, OmpR family, response regulator
VAGEDNMRVLVVEDEADLARALRQALEEDGYAVDVARDGQSAFVAAKGCDFDAIVLDLMIPRLDGWGVLRKLRAEGRAMPVLILTARDTVADKIRGLDEGADDYLTKPFDIEELLARVRALIRRAAGQSSPVLRFGDVEIDTAAGIVRKGGQLVEVTAKEYALVELLAHHCGKLVTRSMIYEHIYDEDDETLSNVVDVYISNLRKKLGKDFITTRRGQGYLIDG